MVKNIFWGIMNMLNFNSKNKQAKRILDGKEEPTHTVHMGRSKFRDTKGGRYFFKAIAKRRKRNKLARKTRQKQRLVVG